VRRIILSLTVFLVPGALFSAEPEVSTFPAYVDSDICARLMLGPITTERMDCSKKTVKDGSNPVLVRLANNMVLTANKEKTIKPFVGQFATVQGEIKPKDGTVKVQSAMALSPDSIPKGDPSRRLLDRASEAPSAKSTELREKIRHELASLPYITYFDFISFSESDGEVILTGWTLRTTNRDGAVGAVRSIPGVENVINNIDLLPVGQLDMQIRAATLAQFQQQLSKYFWGSGSDIKIIVKNGNVILIGTVINEGDKDIAFIRANSVRGAFKVFNLLKVQPRA
jgi:osmotically-inducible protein OsmY